MTAISAHIDVYIIDGHPFVATDEIAIFGDHPTVWHRILDVVPHVRRTACGRWPDTFAKFAAVRPVEHAMGGGKCERPRCRCHNTLPLCRQCAKAGES